MAPNDGFIPTGNQPAPQPAQGQPGQQQQQQQGQQGQENNQNTPNNAGNEPSTRFSWLKGLVTGNDPEPTPAPVQQQQQPVVVQQQAPQPSAEDRMKSYLEGVPVVELSLTDEQLQAFRDTGDMSGINQQFIEAQRQGHLQTLQAADTIFSKRLEKFEKEILQKTNVNNLGKNLLDHAKDQFPEQAKDEVLGPVIEGAVKTMYKNGVTDKSQISEGVRAMLRQMGVGLGMEPNAVMPGQLGVGPDGITSTNSPDGPLGPTVDTMEKPGAWLDLMKGNIQEQGS